MCEGWISLHRALMVAAVYVDAVGKSDHSSIGRVAGVSRNSCRRPLVAALGVPIHWFRQGGLLVHVTVPNPWCRTASGLCVSVWRRRKPRQAQMQYAVRW